MVVDGPTAPPGADRIARYATAITASRGEFERTYDSRASTDPKRVPFKFAVLGTAGDVRGFEAALRQAEAEGWFAELFVALHEAGGLSNATTSTAAQDSEPPPIYEIAEAFVNPKDSLLRPEQLSSGVLNAMRRVCRVRVSGDRESQGTGFLVGPQAILTCCHVVEDLIDANGVAKPDSQRRLTVEFDVVGTRRTTVVGVPGDWLVAYSPCPVSARFPRGFEAPTTLTPDTLDFALIRVAGSPGRHRGLYRLDSTRLPPIQKRVFVFQHPEQFHQRIGDTSDTQWHDPVSQLLLTHKANTAQGSSGGLMVDEAFEAVALHRCALVDAQGTPQCGGAVPTARIAPLVQEKASQVEARFDPIARLVDTRAPVYGRRRLHECLVSAAEGKRRIVVVRGDPRSGKRFTIEIMKSLFPAAGNAICSLAASEIPADARMLAATILKSIEPQSVSTEELPLASGTATTMAAYLKDELFPAFARRLEQAMRSPPRLAWLILHALEKHSIPDTPANDFLKILYARADTVGPLRIVLIGLAGSVPAANPEIVLEERIAPIVLEDFQEWISRMAVEANVVLGDGEASRLARYMTSLADEQAERLPALQREGHRWLRSLGADSSDG